MSIHSDASNADQGELDKFADLADTWWDSDGPSRPLHDLNPCRSLYVSEHVNLRGARVLDVGCGGGILSEALARAGADVLGIDANAALIDVARAHCTMPALHYECAMVEQLPEHETQAFDVITCLELLEHVPDPAQLIADCARLVRAGGTLFFSTINRNPRAYASAIIGAEYLLRLLPRGTHDYLRFIKPSELSRWARAANLSLKDISGMRYNPFTRRARLCRELDVNFIACFEKL